MHDLPDAQALIQEARRTLLEALADALPKARRYDALMIANALAIAAREMEDGAAAHEADRHAVADYLGAGQERDERADLGRLADEIRAGKHDGAAALHKLLQESTLRRLRITNPKLVSG